MIMSDPAMLPPGFRFHPTDEELILHYLRNRAAESPCPVSIIADVDIYKFDPWELPSKARYGDREWYFFTPRDRKYPNGVRPNRAAGSGYWKATGTDKPIRGGATGESVGVKKALVFYKGRPPKGIKTNWIMHEYRLAAADAHAGNTYRPMKFRNASMRLDDWVLCRIYKKSGQASPMVPPLADYDHLDHDELSGGFDDTCFYAPSSSSACRTMIPQHQQQAAASTRLPKIPSISELFDEYALAHIFDTAVPAEADHHLAVHPSLNQLLFVGDSVHAEYYTSSSSSQLAAASAGKRNASPAEECAGHPAAKRLNGPCFDAAPQPWSGLQATSSVLGGLNHHMLPQL